MTITKVKPTLFVKEDAGILKQLIQIQINNKNAELVSGELLLKCAGQEVRQKLPAITVGDSEIEAFIPEAGTDIQLTVSLLVNNHSVATNRSFVSPPKHWTVHVVQLSHHDLGYTGLPSNVLRKQARYLDQAIDMAEATTGFPTDAQFRIVIEQSWSIDYFLKNTTPERAGKMIRLMQSGQFELTALFGNMTTELCGHESLIRTLYPSFRLKKKYGIPIVSAEHNDITGISWGLCRLLTDAGIKIFCPGMPLYYNWADPPYQSFWDQQAIFGVGTHGIPGAFWWEAATGKKILFWCNNKGCGGSADLKMRELIDTLDRIKDSNYPGPVMRWPVAGGGRDNSPYTIGFAETIKEWNETWAYPKLICSTNAGFYKEFVKTIPDNLPVHRGELPGQDYPVGAMSTARTTALNRNNHHDLITAEKLAAVARTVTDYEHQTYELENAWESTMYFEEHAWGHTYSHGPAMVGAEAEKAVHACRTAAYAHDVKQKALAKIADNIRKDSDDIHLVVFNPLGTARTGVVRMPMREIENSEIIMADKDGILTAAALPGRTERGHLILPEEIIAGGFELLDAESDEKVDFQLLKISVDDPSAAYAAQRVGLAQGRKEYFNHCRGWDYDCCFVVENVPAMGYKTYHLQPLINWKPEPAKLTENGSVIENEFYRIAVDTTAGKIVSVFDKEKRRELIDSDAPHGFGEIVLRSPFADSAGTMAVTEKPDVQSGKIVSSISITSSIHGHPVVHQAILLYAGIKKIDFAVRILKDATPLLEAHIAFPFAMSNPRFRYEGTLNILEPVKDFLPGAYSDALTIQNWVEISDDDYSLIWSSHDAPVLSLGQLWPGYVSPAHSCVIPKRMRHLPQQKNDFKQGWIYSNIFSNNFCTNFSVNQHGEFIFRYSMTTAAEALSAARAIITGADLSTPLEHIFSSSQNQGKLPQSGTYIKIANSDVILLNSKLADNGKGIVMRFWNPTGNAISSRIDCPLMAINKVFVINPVEEQTVRKLEADQNSFQLEIKSFEIVSVYIDDQ